MLAHLPCDSVALARGRDARTPHRHGDELARQQRAERVCKIAVPVFRKIAQQPRVELFRREGRFQIDAHLIAAGLHIAQVAACAENHGAGRAARDHGSNR